MNVNFQLKEGYSSVVSNNRGHEVTLDLPKEANGTDKGAKAFELLAMSLAGCIGTIFKMVAVKMRLDVQDIRVELETEEADTITNVSYRFYIKSDSPVEKIKKCLEHTEANCPVGILFAKAGVKFQHELIML
ncbi:OsmC family protein [Porphyromonadaceae bacterium W3.11]|nr:OsmC family protein [Porphyromonadaceae bacterium W3.11]